MNEMKIWTLEGSCATPLDAIGQMESELNLEETLVSNPKLLLNGLTLVGRQTPTEGGPLDLLGVDEYGRLCVFELKRGVVARDAVAQVIDYASDLDGMGWTDLCSLISENSGSNGIEEIEDFEAWHSQNYDGLESLKPLRLFLVGLGADDRTERMVKFLADNSGMDISLLTFQGFAHGDKTLLAKQVEVEGGIASERARAARTPPSREEREARLNDLIEDYGIRDLFGEVAGMLQENWRNSSQRIGAESITFRLRKEGRQRPHARVHANGHGMVAIVFYRRAFALRQDDFRRVTETEIPDYGTFPRNPHALDEKNNEIQFYLNADDWERHKETLTSLAKAVYAAWEGGGADEADSAG